MTSSTQALPGGARPETAHGLGHLLKQGWDAYWARRAQNATVFLLRGLDDRTLQDIGVERSEIESLVYAKSDERVRRYEPQWR
jgi:uncharacterized protein YjiS (DUF1127 family)